MPARITVRKTTVSDNTKAHIEEAYAKLEHFCDRIVDCEVVLEKGAKHGTAVEFIVKVPKQTLVETAENADDNLFRSIDEAYSHVERQLKKYHDKTVQHR